MNEQVLKDLYDALAAARLIDQFSQGKGYEDYVADPLLSAGIERKFEIIDEALTRVRKRDLASLERISNGSRLSVSATFSHTATSMWMILSSGELSCSRFPH